MFLILYGLSYSRFRRLKEHYEDNGLSKRTHGNCKRLPPNTLPHALVEDVKVFLANYVEENAISLPGRIPATKTTTLNCFLPTKRRWAFGMLLKVRVRRRESRLLAIQSSSIYGNNSTPALLSQNR